MTTNRRELLNMALLGHRRKIEEIEAELARSNKADDRPTDRTDSGRRHKISKAGRERIAAAQRKRWAAHKATGKAGAR